MILQIEQLKSKVGVLAVPELAASVVLKTAIVGKHIEWINPTTGLTSSSSSSPVADVRKMLRDYIMIL